MLFSFIWLVVSTWRWKFRDIWPCSASAFLPMPGPTLLLMLVLLLPYMLFLGSRRNGRSMPPASCSSPWRRALLL